VAIDPHPPTGAQPVAAVPAIENEFPSYRAISPLAVLSAVLGALAVLSFANLGFLALSVGAVLTGLMADRKIRRLPDVLTGRGLAQAGLALGTIFALGSLTLVVVERIMLYRDARTFAERVIKSVRSQRVADVLWYKIPPHDRRSMTPEQVKQKFDDQAHKDRAFLQTEAGPIYAILDRLKKGGTIRLGEVEAAGSDGIESYGAVVLRIESPAKDKATGPEYALLDLQGVSEGRTRKWWVRSFKFPYKPNTYTPPAKAVDDGHGHGHGHGG
jgi:hypothetical protein